MAQGILEIMGNPMVVVLEDLDARVVIAIDYIKRTVRRSVIGNNQFVIVTQLREDAVQLFPEIFFAIVRGHADASHIDTYSQL